MVNRTGFSVNPFFAAISKAVTTAPTRIVALFALYRFPNPISGIISSVCVSAGVLFPILALIAIGVIYVLTDGRIYLEGSHGVSSWIPDPDDKLAVLMFLNVVFGYVGVEVSASHAREVKNVHRTYPLAIFIAAVIGFTLTLAGGFVIAIVLPVKGINVVSGAVQAFGALGTHFGLEWLLPVAAVLVAFGAAGQVSTWIFGPVKGLLATARMGDLPPFFQKTNKADAPRNLLLVQACTLSVISLAILVAPNVNTAFMVLTTESGIPCARHVWGPTYV